jgi:hypothetical protein
LGASLVSGAPVMVEDDVLVKLFEHGGGE